MIKRKEWSTNCHDERKERTITCQDEKKGVDDYLP
jgi:hypothetical protein